jgi:hypothetical protein
MRCSLRFKSSSALFPHGIELLLGGIVLPVDLVHLAAPQRTGFIHRPDGLADRGLNLPQQLRRPFLQ